MKFTYLIALLFLIDSFASSAQVKVSELSAKENKLYQKARLLANKGKYEKSTDLFKKILKSKPTFVEAYARIGGNHYSTKNFVLAESNFRKAIELDPNYDNELYYSLAQTLTDQKKFLEAGNTWNTFASREIKNRVKVEKAKFNAENCFFRANALENPVPFKPINLGSGVNTQLSEYFPQISLDGSSLVFTRRSNNEDFYASTYKDGIFGPSIELNGLNTSQNEGAHSLSADGRFFVFTACHRFDAFGSCDLYFSFFENGQWSPAKNMGHVVNSAGKDTQPTLSTDGKTLYFASNRLGSLGGMDIWMTKRDSKGKWISPINLGPNINTRMDEEAPFLHADGVSLYFISEGWPGMGNSDIFYSLKGLDTWSQPVNFGYPINTEGVEVGLCVSLDGKTAYFSSDYDFASKKKLDHQDIFSFEMPQSVRPKTSTYIKGIIKDSETLKTLSATVQLIDLVTKDTIYESLTASDGYFITSLPPGNYAIVVSNPNFIYYTSHFESKSTDVRTPLQLDVLLDPIKPVKKSNKVIVLNNIFFESGSDKLLPTSDTELDLIARMLIDQPLMRIKIIGHTDNVGSEIDNLDLSKRRALSVINAISQRNVNFDRLESEGMGENKPLDTNDTEEGRSRNRRTEFIIL
jgi:outer membrane protein OmpA-like peptidoglycan-associated protein/tetratricopeptide (TPR) repeat protein